MNPTWTAMTYLLARARSRARAALDGNPESGALTLEWIVIAGILVVVASAAVVWFRGAVKGFEQKIP